MAFRVKKSMRFEFHESKSRKGCYKRQWKAVAEQRRAKRLDGERRGFSTDKEGLCFAVSLTSRSLYPPCLLPPSRLLPQ